MKQNEIKKKIIANIKMELTLDISEDNCFCVSCGLDSRYECNCFNYNQALEDVIKLIEEL